MTKKQPREVRLNQIIDAAVDEFLERGYDKASIDSIARRAGLTKGGIYHHFGAKDEILLAANNRFYAPIVAMMGEAIDHASADEGLREYMRRSLEHWVDNPRVVVFTFLSWSKMLSIAPLWPQTEAYVESMVAFFQAMLDRGVAEGSYRAHDTAARAMALMSALDGATVYLITSSHRTARDTAAQFEKVFLDVVRIPADRGEMED